MRENLINRAITSLMLLALLLLFCYQASRAFLDSYLWMDEAGQFFMSKGLHHHSDKLLPIASWVDLFKNNSLHNLDPGGFTVLLRLWSYLGNGFIWLRGLPLLLYICCLVVTYKATKRVFQNKILPLIVVSVLLIHPAFSINSCELRAYSMEMLGVTLTMWMVGDNSRKWTLKKLIILGIVLSIFITSRYSFVLFAFATILYIYYELVKLYGYKHSVIKVIALGIFPLLTVFAIYVFSLRFQMGVGEVDYVASQYVGSSIKALFAPASIRMYILLCIAAVYLKKKQSIDPLLCLAVVVSIVFFVASLFNFYPIDERRAMSLSMIQCLVLLIWFMSICKKAWQIRTIKMGVTIAVCFVFVLWPKLTSNRQKAISEFRNFKEIISNIASNKKLVVCSYYDASVRYAIEFGDLKGKVSNNFYKENILFDGSENRNKVIKRNLENISYFYYREKNLPVLESIVKVKKVKDGIYIKENNIYQRK